MLFITSPEGMNKYLMASGLPDPGKDVAQKLFDMIKDGTNPVYVRTIYTIGYKAGYAAGVADTEE